MWKNLGMNWIFFFDLLGVAILWKWFSELANSPRNHGLVEGFPVFGTRPKRVCSISYSGDGLFQLSCTGVPTVNGHVEPARK